mmetsp:Transcript_120080/g.346907  ORF Transcript_120080/g.346907 Transcript_120080/m.346907 type:complete len:229 (-) Transcript_120080:105-791(-)
MFACCCEHQAADEITLLPVQTVEARGAGSGAGSMSVGEPEPEKASAALADTVQADPAPAEIVAQCTLKDVKEKIGLRLELFDLSPAHIAEVEAGGAIARYNASVPEELRICRGDYIVSVNGKSLSSQMAATFKSPTSEALELRVKRPSLSTVTASRNGRRWGMMLKYDKNGASVLVTSLDADGALSLDGVGIRVGDRILSVNSKSGSVEQLLAELQVSDEVELILSRM